MVESNGIENVRGSSVHRCKNGANIGSSITPWIPPLCRGNVVNTEHMKSKNSQANCSATPVGCPKTLADLQSLSAHNLQEVCSLVGIPLQANYRYCTLHLVPGNDYIIFYIPTCKMLLSHLSIMILL